MSKPLPRIVRVLNADEIAALIAGQECFNAPRLYVAPDESFWADADELRAWREKRASGNQSEVAK